MVQIYLLHTLCTHCIFVHMRGMKYQPIFHTLYSALHHSRILNNVGLTTVIEMVEILDGRVHIAFS